MLIEFILYLILSIIGCTIYYKWAQKNQIVDTPNERSSHTHQPVRGMGVVFPALFALVSLHIWFTGGEYHLTSPLVPMFKPLGSLWIGIGVLLIGITGYIDDRIDLKSYIRLPLYCLSAVIVLVPVILSWEHHILWIPVLVVIMVGIINTYNFMDGINGITGFYSIVLLSSVYYLFEVEDLSVFIGAFSHIIIFGIVYLLVFGFYNYRTKALAFLGDAGSVSLGVFTCILLVWAGILYHRLDLIVLLLVYGVDSVGTILIRLIRKENIFKAHRSHFYQDLVHVKGIQHLQVAFIYALLQAIINAVYIYYFDAINLVFTITLVLLSIVFVVGKKQMGTLQLKTNNE